ncbi:hypothetical protein FQV39_18100 [Bosea sp. F3-2]|jgi:hypothetical protein|uniref:hypothetical protein n=1 Tax=Bosea sp. F3-2 TaxID=2599640 RepID=UPI0011EBD2AA|nr:hypothetical protein [Bosea sp. F3-2]QEL24279.1 hypothetical protein FQV39_18100 [Bosea sp. F3-2]
MSQVLTDNSELGWFVNFIAWWCSLFGSQDTGIIRTAAAVVIGGILLMFGYSIIKLLIMVVTRAFR